jgi:hypothetical protein
MANEIDLDNSKASASAALDHAHGLRNTLAPAIEESTSVEWLVATAKHLHAIEKTAKAEKEKVAKPLRDATRAINAFWKPVLDEVAGLKNAAKCRARAVQESQIEEQKQALTDATSPEEVARAVAVVTPMPKGLSQRSVLSFEILDETQIPRRFWTLNEAEVRQALRAGETIPGIQATTKVIETIR